MELNYTGDDYYAPASKTFDFNITYVVMPEEILYYPDERISGDYQSIGVYKGLTGVLIVKIGDIEVAKDFVNGEFGIYMENITLGVHDYEIRYLGDSTYEAFTKNGTVNYTYPMYITTKGVYGNETTINVKLPNDATGNVTITINNENITKEVNNGYANFTINNLAIGEYAFIANYSGDKKYPNLIYDGTVSVKYEILATIKDKTLTVSVNLPESSEGKLYVDIDGEDTYYKNIENGAAILNITLNIGYHDVYAWVSESGYSVNSYNDYIFISGNVAFDINYTDEIVIDTDEKFSVIVESDINGNLTIYITDYDDSIVKVIRNLSDVTGKVEFSLSEISKFGKYFINVEFKSNESEAFESDLISISPKITMPDIMCSGDDELFAVELPSNSKGNLTLYLIDMDSYASQKINLTVNNGKAEYSLKNLSKGSYLLKVNYADEEYGNYWGYLPAYEYDSNLEVTSPLPQVNVKTNEGDLMIELPLNATGIVMFTLNNIDYSKSLEDGIAIFNDVDLTGVLNISLSYAGDANYSRFKDKTYTIEEISTIKTDANLTITTADIKVGKDAVIIVSINQNITAGVIVNINNENHTVVLTNGKGNVTVSDLTAGSYNVTVTFEGNEFFMESQKTAVINVSKNDNELIVNVESEYYIGTDFNISILSNTSVNVTIDGDVYDVVDGRVVVDTISLKEGTYTVIVNAFESDKYLSNTTTKVFTIKKYDSNLTVTAEDITLGEDAIINVSINENIKGIIVYSLNGTNTTVEIENGTGTIILPNLTSGTYDIVVSFTGDDIFSSAQKTATFNVIAPAPKFDPRISANDLSTLYTDASLYRVQVFGIDGKVASGVSVQFSVNGKVVATQRSDKNGYASFKTTQTPGTYTVTSKALGVGVNKKLTVNGILSLKTASVKKSAKKLVLQATLKKVNGKYLKNKKITFKFNGKKYSAKTNSKGVAKLTIKKTVLKKLKVGKKITYQATYLKQTISKNVKVKK